MSREYTLQRAHPALASAIDYAADLNEQQYAAVTAPPGPLLVIAGAGSGKTRTLTYRVAYLLENGVEARNILLLTFTNKAARQMLDRVANLLPVDATGIWGGTFHSIGNRMLRRHGSALQDHADLQGRRHQGHATGRCDNDELRLTRAGAGWSRMGKVSSARTTRRRGPPQ